MPLTPEEIKKAFKAETGKDWEYINEYSLVNWPRKSYVLWLERNIIQLTGPNKLKPAEEENGQPA